MYQLETELLWDVHIIFYCFYRLILIGVMINN
jgi:hypothetical protein